MSHYPIPLSASKNLENQINDRISFKKFLGLPLDKPSPDHSTFSRFIIENSKVSLFVMALQMERYMTSRLQPLKISAQTALEKLRQIKAGQVVLNGAKAPVITALGEEHKEIFTQLELSFAKIKQLQDL